LCILYLLNDLSLALFESFRSVSPINKAILTKTLTQVKKISHEPTVYLVSGSGTKLVKQK